MTNDLYNMIFKRKSFRRFNKKLKITKEELIDIENKIKKLTPLVEDIEIRYKIVPKTETTCKRGEYCILIYSKEEKYSLLNVGYMFEQLDLYLASKNIGVCWYGMGKVKEQEIDGCKYVIMMNLGKGLESEFRKDYKKSRRKETKVIWKGDLINEIGDIVKYAPSACNSQPWRVVCKDNILKVFRTTKIRSIMPKNKASFYNSIDMGIFLCFLELALSYNGLNFKRELCVNEKKSTLIPIAKYILENKHNY